MATKDPTEPIRLRASRYAGVDEGAACTQSSFKAGKKAFLFIGEQGGRYKAMFKLKASLPEAERLAERSPADFQVGSWVTARFSADKPLPKRLWQKWLDESYELNGGAKATTMKTTRRKTARKKSARKKVAKKKTAKRARAAR